MSTNGNGHASAPEWIALQKHSQLSAAQRSRLTDDMVAAIQEQRYALNALTRAVNQLEPHVREHRAMLDAHACVVLRQTFWGRLRWLLTGR